MPVLSGYSIGRVSGGGDGGSGAGGAGGIPAAVLFETGLSASDKRDQKWKGLLVGLERAEAGPDWSLATQARNPVANTQAKYVLASGANSITITLPEALAVGADGNEWDFVTEASSDNVARVDQANKRIVVRTVGFGLAQLAGWINAIEALRGSAVVVGNGNTNFVGNAVPRQADFSGGVTAQAIGATADEATKVVTLIYDNNDTQSACRDAWEGFEIDKLTKLRCSEIGTWNGNAKVEARASVTGRAFDLFYSEGSLPLPRPISHIEMVAQMSPASLNKSNPPLNLHVTVSTPVGAFPDATTVNFQLGPEISASIVYDPDVSVHRIQYTLSDNAKNVIAGSLVDETFALEVSLRDGRNNVVHKVTRTIEVVEEAPPDPKVLVGTLQWDVNPSSIAGVAADDLEGTYRAQFDTPYFPLTDYYFEAFIKGANGTAQSIRDRAQWAQVTHLDLAIDATEAGQIARDVFAAGDDHFDIELHFFTDAVTLGAVAVTSRRLRIGQASAGGGLTPEQAAAISANSKLSGENKVRLDALPSYAAQMAVWPPNVEKHSGFQRKFQSTLSGLAASLATDAGATGTHFTNVFRIFTRLSDGTVIQLHTEGWAFTEDDRQTVEWEVSAAEFNAVGASAATNGVEVWGEFRAVYGGGVDELRGRTNPVFIDFGDQAEWPASRGDLKAAIDALPDASGLTQAQQIALLSLVAKPGGISFKGTADLAAKVKTIRINVQNPEILTGDVWVEGWTQGQPGGGARTKWANNVANLDIVLSDASARAVSTALIASDDEEVEVRLRFYDAANAGNEIERIGLNLPLVNIGIEEIDNSREADFQGLKIWYGTKAQFDALAAKDASTIYFYPPA